MVRMGKAGRTNLVRTAAALREDGRVGKVLPSALTLLGLCSGATAIWFALGGDWKAGVAAILCAAIFDMLDGRLARLFGVAGAFGAQLELTGGPGELRHRAGGIGLHVDLVPRSRRRLGFFPDFLRRKRHQTRAVQR